MTFYTDQIVTLANKQPLEFHLRIREFPTHQSLRTDPLTMAAIVVLEEEESEQCITNVSSR